MTTPTTRTETERESKHATLPELQLRGLYAKIQHLQTQLEMFARASRYWHDRAMAPEARQVLDRSVLLVADRPKIVCLCGSTRFSEAFQAANLRETLAGNIVLTIGCDMRSDGEIFAHLPAEELQTIKNRLDALHLRKIDLADEVLILDVGGYIGESTRRELEFALLLGKPVRYLSKETSHAAS